MEPCRLVKPDLSFEKEILAYREETVAAGVALNGMGALRSGADVPVWLEQNRLMEKRETTPEGLVPADQYLYVRVADGRVVGMIQLRRELNEDLLNYGGNIGYSVRPSEWRKGYAKAMLADCLAICRDRGIPRVLITCRTDNVASRRTILANGGVYEDTRFCAEKNQPMERYWVTLSSAG